MGVQKSPEERLVFGLRWENVRLAYFQSIGRKSKVHELNQRLNAIQYQLDNMYKEAETTSFQ